MLKSSSSIKINNMQSDGPEKIKVKTGNNEGSAAWTVYTWKQIIIVSESTPTTAVNENEWAQSQLKFDYPQYIKITFNYVIISFH